MTGQWLPPAKPEHRCALPDLGVAENLSRMPGERWECECGQVFVVVAQSQHGESWNGWERERK